MPCAKGSPDAPNGSTCQINTAGHTVGVLSGYATSAGYDQATGLGSVNAANLIGKFKTFNSSLKSSNTTATLTSVSPATSLTGLVHGQSVQIAVAVTGSGGTPTGTVSLMASIGSGPAQGVASADLANGTATFSTASLPGGSYSVFARYSGDATFASSSSSPTSVSVAPEASKISIAYELYNPNNGAITNPNATSAAFDSPALLRVNVTSQAGDACSTNGPPPSGNTGCPTGSVMITDSVNGGTPTPLDGGTFALNSQGYAEDQSIFLGGGTHNLAVTYNGDGSYTTSTQAAATITIVKAPTTITLNGPGSAQTLGSPVTLTAIVNTQIFAPPAGFSPSTAAGSVTFFAGGAPIVPGSSATVSYQILTNFSNGTAALYATLSITSLPVGTNTVTAQYNGDQNYAASGPSNAQQFVVLMSTTTSLSSSLNAVVAGTSVNFTATVAPTQSGVAAPTGTVTIVMPFDENAGSSTTATLVGNQAQGTLVMPAGSIGVHATYNGDANNAPSTSAYVTENATPIGTSLTLMSSSSSSQAATPVVFTAIINSTPANGPPAAGAVNLTVGSLNIASGSVSNGQAVITTDGLPAGSDNVVATYAPDLYRSSSTASIQETVSKGTIPITVTSLTPTIVVGSFVSFVAQLQLVKDAPFPTAFVQFSANGTPFGNPVPIPINGQVTISTNSLPMGTVTIAADYPGDSNYNASSGTFSEVVNPQQPDFSVSANPASLTIGQPGQSAMTTLTFTSQDNLAGTGGFATSTCGTSSTEEISCSLSSFNLPANGTATATLAFTTTAPGSSSTASARYDRFVLGVRPTRLILFSIFFSMIALSFALRREDQRWRLVFGALIFAVIVSGVSCGGGNSGNNPPPNPGTPVGNVSPLTVSITIDGVTRTVANLTLTVN